MRTIAIERSHRSHGFFQDCYPDLMPTPRAQARNIRDDYAWYFAAADYYITERGMIAYIGFGFILYIEQLQVVP